MAENAIAMEEYQLVSVLRAWGLSSLAQAVNDQIKQGWKPVGDITQLPATEYEGAEICQRMSRVLDSND